MLYPQNNRCRTVLDLSGFWEIRTDPDGVGIEKEWENGFIADAYIGIPGSWNEQLSELGLMNYVGAMWYQTRFHIPEVLSHRSFYLRFGSADFHAQVWVNGKFAGKHLGGYLPFEFDITSLVERDQENVLVVCVDNTLSHDTIPQGVTVEDYVTFQKKREQSYPPTAFDFFPYGGIHRPVKLVSLHELHLRDVRIETSIHGAEGRVEFESDCSRISDTAQIEVSLWDNNQRIGKQTNSLEQPTIRGEFAVPDCRFWSHEKPHLYKMHFELFGNNALVDEYQLEVGVREIQVRDTELLLNGKPVFLKGFGKHEDFPVLGKGLSFPLIIKDFQLMKWIGANSFRTSHYPYAEEIMQMADRLGFLVIDEVPAVSLNFKHVTDKTLENHRKSLSELITRDRNHPSVICWSVANEPGIWGEEEAVSKKADIYWREIFHHVKTLDSTRPATLPACAEVKDRDPSFRYVDFISLNRYWGWYDIPGEIEKAGEYLQSELEALYEKYRKPIFVSEFGADTIEGKHATYPQLYTEEYQIELIQKYFEVIESLPFTIGEHIWNFADFRTAQHHRRVILNRKGVFNRQREPKSVAFTIRKHWIHEDTTREVYKIGR